MTDTPTPPALIDAQDPLPESNWLWRRVLTFSALVITFAIMVGLGYAVHRIVGALIEKLDTMDAANAAAITKEALVVIQHMFDKMFYALAMVITYYMVAPSAEQIVKMISAASLLKSGVTTRRHTLYSDPDRSLEQSSATGRPADRDLRPVESDSGLPGADTPGPLSRAPTAPPWGA